VFQIVSAFMNLSYSIIIINEEAVNCLSNSLIYF
jgi:hypothetical protein